MPFRATAALMGLIVCLLAPAGAKAQQRPPDFLSPQEFGLEEFEPAVREQVGRAYEQIRRHPGDAAPFG